VIKPILQMENVAFSYPNNPVLYDVSLTIYPGEFIGLIGPNGGGKTTLLKLIMGFLKPTKGKIVLSHDSLAYVPQSIHFDRQFPISVLEVVLSGLLSRLPWYGKFHETDQQLALATLERVGLAHLSQEAFGRLSGGQAQRVLIARALVSQPQLLLLDEPTASVDSQAEADIYTLLKKLKGEMTILMVTHDLRAAIEQVQRLFCVQGCVFSLKPEEVCQHFSLGLFHSLNSL
jgi:zinc transport system ATP-binding protein